MSRHGFDYTGEGRIPEYMILDVPKRSVRMHANEMPHAVYLHYKVRRLEEVIKLSVEAGMLNMSGDEILKLNHRTNAVKSVRAELDQLKLKDKENK